MGSTKDNIPWNKGIKGLELKTHYRNGFKGTFKKGHFPWNKGKTNVYSEETKEAMSKTAFKEGHIPWNKGKTGIMSGEKNPFYGKHHSKEAKRKISETHRGNTYCLGRCPSEGTRNKMSQVRKDKQKGEDNPAWKGGVTPLNHSIRNNADYKDWHKAILGRDYFSCQICGQYRGNLRVHHINNFADFPELRFAVDNGITLCKDCHKKYHKIYGEENNTREQFEEFKRTEKITVNLIGE